MERNSGWLKLNGAHEAALTKVGKVVAAKEHALR